MKRIKTIFLAALMVALVCTGFSACSNNDGADYVVGISKFLTVAPLDQSQDGFVDKLTELMAADKKTVEFDFKDASSDVAQAQTIATTFVSKKVDLIYAIATPSAITAKTAADNSIPVVFCAVTDPADPATGLVDTYESPGGNITGASDKNPINEQLALFQELYGDVPVKKIAIIYSAEPNSIAQLEMLQNACDASGIELVAKLIASTSEIQTQFQAISDDKDIMGIYLGADNMVADGAASIKSFNQEITRLPIVVNDSGFMHECGGIASFGFEYYKMGESAAEMAYRILTGKAKAEDIPVYFQSADELLLDLNTDAAAAIDFEIPQALQDRFAEQG